MRCGWRPRPDGRTIASGDDLGAIRLWDLATGKSRSLVSEHSIVIQYLVFSPDSRTVAAATIDYGEIFIWDVVSGRLRGTLDRSAHRAVSALLFSTDGGRLAALGRQPGAGVRAVELWDVQSSPGTFPILGPQDDPATVADMADARLRSLAELMDDRSPSWSGSLADLKRSWIEHAPRGIVRTQDQTMGLIAQGDGAFELYWLEKIERAAVGRIHAHGCALVFFDAECPDGNYRQPSARRASDWRES